MTTGSHLDYLKIFTFPSSTNIDRTLAEHWYQVVSNLHVIDPLQSTKQHVLALIEVMKTERVVITPFNTLPRRQLKTIDQRKLLELSYLTEEKVLVKIKEERARRLCTAFKSLQTYKFQKPWIIFLHEDEELFLTDNMADGDQLYFIIRALQLKNKLRSTQLTLNCQKFLVHIKSPVLPNLKNRVHVIYFRTGTKLEAQLALYWLLLINRSTNIDDSERSFLIELTFNLFNYQRLIPPFTNLPRIDCVQNGKLSDEVKYFTSNFPRNEFELIDRLTTESGMRTMAINRTRFGNRRLGFLLDYFEITRYHVEQNQTINWFLNQARPKYFWEREKMLEKNNIPDVEANIVEKIEICSHIPDKRREITERRLPYKTLLPEEMEKLLAQDIADISMPSLDISFDPDVEDRNFNRDSVFLKPHNAPVTRLENTSQPKGFNDSLSMIGMTSLIGRTSFPTEKLSGIEPPPELNTSLTEEYIPITETTQDYNPIPSPPADATDAELALYRFHLQCRLGQAVHKLDLTKIRSASQFGNSPETINTQQVGDSSKTTPLILWPYSSIEDDDEEELDLVEDACLWEFL